MTGNPAAAPHLAELDARFEAHVAEVRRRAERAKAELAGTASLLAERLAPAPTIPDLPSLDALDREPQPAFPDSPLVAVDDDGIPLWDDAPNP